MAAEDVVQDAFLKLYADSRNDEISSMEAYLSRLVRNLAIDRVRRLRLERQLFDPEADTLWCPAAGMSCPEASLRGRQAVCVLAHTVEKLPERTREAFIRHRLGEQAQKDIASAMGVSRALVCNLVKKADDQCRQALETEDA